MRRRSGRLYGPFDGVVLVVVGCGDDVWDWVKGGEVVVVVALVLRHENAWWIDGDGGEGSGGHGDVQVGEGHAEIFR